jgi:hypothetical protein
MAVSFKRKDAVETAVIYTDRLTVLLLPVCKCHLAFGFSLVRN